jgi:hypothetical protein
MTIRPAQLIRSGCRLRTALALAVAVGTSTLLTTDVEAQTNTASGSAQNSGTAGQVGNSNSDSVFAETATSDGFETAGESQGRFQGSQLSTQPTAGGNTNTTQQNALNNARNLQRLSSQFNNSNRNRNTGSTQGTRTIRPSLRLGFTPKLRPTKDLQESLGKRLKALSTSVPSLIGGRSEYASVKFDFAKQGEIVLSGSVPNEDASQLLANILRMEPGVSSVRNDLKIVEAAE